MRALHSQLNDLLRRKNFLTMFDGNLYQYYYVPARMERPYTIVRHTEV